MSSVVACVCVWGRGGRAAFWGGAVPLAMVLVLGPKPHIQVLTLWFITKDLGMFPRCPGYG